MFNPAGWLRRTANKVVILVLVCFDLQLFWERKLSGLNAFDIAEELVKTMDLPKGLQGEAYQKISQLYMIQRCSFFSEA